MLHLESRSDAGGLRHWYSRRVSISASSDGTSVCRVPEVVATEALVMHRDRRGPELVARARGTPCHVIRHCRKAWHLVTRQHDGRAACRERAE